MLPVSLQSTSGNTASATAASVQPKPLTSSSKPVTASPQQPPMGTFSAIAAVPAASLQHSGTSGSISSSERSSSPHNVSSTSSVVKPAAAAAPAAKPVIAAAAPATVSSVLPAAGQWTPMSTGASTANAPVTSSNAAVSSGSASSAAAQPVSTGKGA
jgi:hypothetical protein